jgi:hypothetical protein
MMTISGLPSSFFASATEILGTSMLPPALRLIGLVMLNKSIIIKVNPNVWYVFFIFFSNRR